MTDGEGNDPFRLGAARVVGSTSKALKVKFDASSIVGESEHWIPKSVIHDDSEVYDALTNARGVLVVRRWFARKEGWECE